MICNLFLMGNLSLLIGNDVMDSGLDRRQADAQSSIVGFETVLYLRFRCSNCRETRFTKVSGSEW